MVDGTRGFKHLSCGFHTKTDLSGPEMSESIDTVDENFDFGWQCLPKFRRRYDYGFGDDWEHIITCTGRTVTAPYMAVPRIMTGSGGLLAVGKVVRRQAYLSGKSATGSVLADSVKPLNTLLHSLVGTTGTHAHLTNTRMRVQNLFNHQTNPQIHH